MVRKYLEKHEATKGFPESDCSYSKSQIWALQITNGGVRDRHASETWALQTHIPFQSPRVNFLHRRRQLLEQEFVLQQHGGAVGNFCWHSQV